MLGCSFCLEIGKSGGSISCVVMCLRKTQLSSLCGSLLRDQEKLTSVFADSLFPTDSSCLFSSATNSSQPEKMGVGGGSSVSALVSSSEQEVTQQLRTVCLQATGRLSGACSCEIGSLPWED